MFNLPIKVIDKEGEFDTNSPSIILLCGQGSSGKTTFWKRYFPLKTIVAIDNIVGEFTFKDNEQLYFLKYINQIRVATSQNEDVVLDFSHDTPRERMKSLVHVSSPHDFNLLVISMSLDFQTLVNNDCRRKGITMPTEDSFNHMLELYDLFVPPSLDEFRSYNFKSIVIAEYKQI